MNLYETIKNITGFNENMIKIAEFIKKSSKIAVIGHTDPDIDCIGSQLALKKAFLNSGKNAYAVSSGPFDDKISGYADFFQREVDDDTDLIIVVDNSSIDRIASANKIDFSKTVVIDHHYTNSGYGIINYVDENFVSASEMVFILLTYLETDFSDIEITQWILNGILSDNGYYRHIRTDKFFSLIASYFLIEMGADPYLSYKSMFCNNSINDVRLLGKLLDRIESCSDAAVLWTYINECDRDAYNSNVSSLFLFKEMMSVKKGKIFVFFKVIESENRVIVSFRSDERYNVGNIAERLGGGGHKVASGASVDGTYQEVKEKVLPLLKELVSG